MHAGTLPRLGGAPLAQEDLPGLRAELAAGPEVTLLLVGEGLGRGPEDLGRKLMRLLLDYLSLEEARVRRVLLVNTGVRLVAPESPVLPQMALLESRGVELGVCADSLRYLSLQPCAGTVLELGELARRVLEAGRLVVL
ncbi:MAG: hypothetical protein M0Z27_12830 [Thermaerobacter sp.]|nr:hypothetical protein [Thermaerobacter sp.]MDA8146927.1 hypothetical protein [Thermaerobacter sp.]